MSDATDKLALTGIEFAASELRWAGSDYGTAYIEATTPDARAAFDKITAAAGRGGARIECDLVVRVHDGKAPASEDWHAGRARTPESGVGAGAAATGELQQSPAGPAASDTGGETEEG